MTNNTEVNVADYLDGYEKFTFNPTTTNNAYLPSIHSLASKLGKSFTFQSIISLIEKSTKNRIDLSGSTLRDIGLKGGSEKSAIKVLEFLSSSTPQPLSAQIASLRFDKRVGTLEEINAPSTEWLYVLTGFENHLSLLTELHLPTQPVISFIKRRVENEYEFLELIKKRFNTQSFSEYKKSRKKHGGGLPINEFETLIEVQDGFLRNGSDIPHDKIDKMTSCFQSTEPRNHDDEALNLALIYSQFDFYLGLIASIEVGVNDYTNKFWLIKNIKPNPRYLSKAIETYYSSEGDSVHSCFDGLLHCMKNELSKKAKSDNEKQSGGWRKIASFINIKSKSSESLSDVHYNQIKKWRIGKDKPSSKSLEGFIANYLEHIDRKEDVFLQLYFYLIILLDNLGKEILDGAPNQEKAMLHIKEVLSQYPIYYKKCQEGKLN